MAYRRSYGRTYEAICCVSHKTDDKYSELFNTHPYDIIGRHVRLGALEAKHHLKDFFNMTSGEVSLQRKSFNPEQVWGFQPEGPFQNEKEMEKSFVFMRKQKEAGFAIINSVTDRLVGVILLTNDNPEHLTIQIEPPIMPPGLDGGQEQFEACFLLMDRLFAYGYRRIQLSIDSQDAENRQLATRLGFTLEGVLSKHLVLKDANRDSNVYGLLNSDWKLGARSALYAKLHGENARKVETANEVKEAEWDEQQRFLAKQKLTEAAESKMQEAKK
jgi:RimJ/RimL family protein N-acetyltransferase